GEREQLTELCMQPRFVRHQSYRAIVGIPRIGKAPERGKCSTEQDPALAAAGLLLQSGFQLLGDSCQFCPVVRTCVADGSGGIDGPWRTDRRINRKGGDWK